MDFSYWYFFVLALLGAVVANATGAGGGVVFVPAFTMLGLSPESIIATSFGIQCFGMTAGTLAWNKYARSQTTEDGPPIWSHYWNHIAWFSVPAIVGVLLGQYLIELDSPAQVKLVFKWFSMAFALSIFATSFYIVKYQGLKQPPVDVTPTIRCLFVVLGLLGGVVTAWLSIGVGELVAVVLILMRYPARMAVGVAVSVSAISVWIGVQKYLWFEPNINLNVLIFAGPAALVGGGIAKRVVSFFSPVQLKLFIATWIFVSAIAM